MHRTIRYSSHVTYGGGEVPDGQSKGQGQPHWNYVGYEHKLKCMIIIVAIYVQTGFTVNGIQMYMYCSKH